MIIKQETRTYRLTGITELLGSNPANPEIHSKYVAAKADSVEQAALEEAMLPGPELDEKIKEIKQQGLTVFLRGNHGELVISQHVIRGFFKSVFTGLKDQFNVANAQGKIDNLVFVSPRFIPILDGHHDRGSRCSLRSK